MQTILRKPSLGAAFQPSALATQATPIQRDGIIRVLTRTLPKDMRHELATAVAESLLACLDRGTLDFTGMQAQPEYEALPCLLRMAAWRALQDVSGQRDGCEISTVMLALGRHSDDLPLALKGLNALSGLMQLELTVPQDRLTIDLTDLHNRDGRVCVQLDCTRVAAWKVRVPVGTRVHAVGPATHCVHPDKPLVEYMDASRFTGVRAALPGLVYLRKPTDFDDAPDKAAAIAWSQANLNFRGRFDDDAIKAQRLTRPEIVCRHLALQWLHDRRDYHAARAERSMARDAKARAPAPQTTARFSFAGFACADAISKHVAPETEAAHLRLTRNGRPPVLVFHVNAFGEALRHLSQQVTGASQFALYTHDHVLGLELQWKTPHAFSGRDRELVVCIYEPNRTATHGRLVVESPSRLTGLALSDMFPRMAVSDFPDDEPAVVACFSIDQAPVGPAPRSTPLIGATDADRRKPKYLSTMVKSGCTSEVRAFTEAMLAGAMVSNSVCELQSQSPFWTALNFGRIKESALLVQAVMKAPSNCLTALQRFRVLTRALAFDDELWTAPLTIALRSRGHIAALLARLVLAAPPDKLPEHLKLSALSQDIQIDQRDLPALFVACAQEGRTTTDTTVLEANVHDVIHAVANDSDLSLGAQRQLIAAREGTAPESRTAAMAALDVGRAGVAGAIVCAIVEAQLVPATRDLLLQEVGVSLKQVLSALKTAPSPNAKQWAQRILHAVCTERTSTQGMLAEVQPFMPVLDGHVPAASTREVRDLLAARHGLAVMGACPWDVGSAHLQLRAAALDQNTAFMRCISGTPIDELAPWTIDPSPSPDGDSKRAGAAAWHYLLPIDRLLALPSGPTRADPSLDATVFHLPRGRFTHAS